MNLNLFRWVLFLGDLGVFYSAIIISLYLRHFTLPELDYIALHIFYFTPLIVLWLSLFYISGLYSRQIFIFKDKSMKLLLLIQFVNISIASIFFFLMDLPIEPKTVLLIYLVVSLFLLFIWRFVLYPNIFTKQYLRIVVLSGRDGNDELINELKNSSIFKAMDMERINLDDIKKNPNKFKELFLNASVLANNDDFLDLYKTILFAGITRNINILSQDEIYDILGRVPQNTWKSFRARAVKANNSRNKILFLFFKRVFDFILALFLLILLLPLMVALYLLIRLKDGRPVIYKSKRRGFAARDFYLYKFRTMTGTDDGNAALKSKLSVTAIGKVLRKLRLDELPQLLNIIKGEMSFVGPRPEIDTLASKYENAIPEYVLRYGVMPGLSGWAQIMHRQDPHHKVDIELTKEKLEYDLFYIKCASVLLDLQVIFQTALAILGMRGR